DRLSRIVEKLLNAAEAGDLAAIKELADRLDGKAVQPTTLESPIDGALRIETDADYVRQKLTVGIAAAVAALDCGDADQK
ncbi:MAG: hypothetical protein ACREQ5_08860, partial [Candidatus Dormibacteria bacterium]